MGNLSLKFVAAVMVIGLVFWLWPTSETSSPVVSAAEIESDLIGEPLTGKVSGSLSRSSEASIGQTLSSVESQQLLSDFKRATEFLDEDRLEEAERDFKRLTKQFPRFVEPYINLAAIATKRGELEEAREFLHAATSANDSTKQLFDSIHHVHGALAAQAYQRALESEQVDKVTIELPVTRTITTDFELAQQVELLEGKLARQEMRLANDSELSTKLQALQSSLEKERAEFSNREKQFEARVTELQASLLASKRANQVSTTSPSSSTNQADKDIIAKLRIELANLETELGKSVQQLTQLQNENQDLSRELATAEKVAIASLNAKSAPQNRSSAPSEKQLNAAIDRVRSWAEAWSNQNLTLYLEHYLPNYSTSQLSRRAWVEQRRLRLTNKSFIQVRVSNFNVVSTDEGFAVTFRQHYRSNTLDDTITKRLDFNVTDELDWSLAKISSEQIIRR